MSFSGDTFTKKLANLQETQDSIVSLGQWVLFHHRFAEDIAVIWQKVILEEKLPNKRLNLLYLCNDVVQQAKRKRKMEFIPEFAKVLPLALKKIYSNLNSTIKGKVDRLISVWEERAVFSTTVITDLRTSAQTSERESKIPTGPSIVPQLSKLNDLFIKYNELTKSATGNYTQFNIQSAKYLGDATDNLPLPKIYLSKLNVIEKLGSIAKTTLTDLIAVKDNINLELNNLLVHGDLSQESSKLAEISKTLSKLEETRSELRAMTTNNEEEEPSPSFDAIPKPKQERPKSKPQSPTPKIDSDDDLLPTYVDSDDSDDEVEVVENTAEETRLGQPSLKRRASTPSGGSTPKKVAFSEDIEVKEFETDDNDENDPAEIDKDEPEIQEFVSHHKDQIELKRDNVGSINFNSQDDADNDSDGYDPEGTEQNNDQGPTDVMSLLMELN